MLLGARKIFYGNGKSFVLYSLVLFILLCGYGLLECTELRSIAELYSVRGCFFSGGGGEKKVVLRVIKANCYRHFGNYNEFLEACSRLGSLISFHVFRFFFLFTKEICRKWLGNRRKFPRVIKLDVNCNLQVAIASKEVEHGWDK